MVIGALDANYAVNRTQPTVDFSRIFATKPLNEPIALVGGMNVGEVGLEQRNKLRGGFLSLRETHRGEKVNGRAEALGR